jgi:hypothetical protein
VTARVEAEPGWGSWSALLEVAVSSGSRPRLSPGALAVRLTSRLSPAREPSRVNTVRLERILETVLYYSSGQEDELAHFYGEVLGLRAVGRGGLTFRVGDGLLLLFDADLSSVQSRPPPHGARGPVHACFGRRRSRGHGEAADRRARDSRRVG